AGRFRHGASFDSGLDLHRPDQPRPHREAARRLDTGPGGRHADRRDEPGRFLYPLPRQRGDARDRRQAHPVGGGRHHREPARTVPLAGRPQGRVRALPARGEMPMRTLPRRMIPALALAALALAALALAALALGPLTAAAETARLVQPPALDEPASPATS